VKGTYDQYYAKDYRKLMMLIALLQFVGIFLIPAAAIIAFFNWKIALPVALVGIIMLWKFGDLNITLSQKWIKFSDESKINSKILYCEMESPLTAEKLRLVADNIGGLFRDGNEIVLGTFKGELRCDVKEFQYDIIKKSALVNYIIIKMGEYRLAIFPKWDGELNEHPTSADKVDWAAKVIDDLLKAA
jgi:hypothetical protein